jgi:hypothetical protein
MKSSESWRVGWILDFFSLSLVEHLRIGIQVLQVQLRCDESTYVWVTDERVKCVRWMPKIIMGSSTIYIFLCGCGIVRSAKNNFRKKPTNIRFLLRYPFLWLRIFYVCRKFESNPLCCYWLSSKYVFQMEDLRHLTLRVQYHCDVTSVCHRHCGNTFLNTNDRTPLHGQAVDKLQV